MVHEMVAVGSYFAVSVDGESSSYDGAGMVSVAERGAEWTA